MLTSPKRLLLMGVTGRLGRALLPYLQDFVISLPSASVQSPVECIALGRDQIDLMQPDRLYKKISQLQPTLIVNAAAYTDVERAEYEEDQANLINGEAVRVLAHAARDAGALLIHYSTNYVFDGQSTTPKQPYRETDPCYPINAYGRSKLLGERFIQASGCDAIIMRVAWLYGIQGKHFVKTILQKAWRGDPLSVVAHERGTPTSVRQVAQWTRMLLTEAQSRREKGLFKSTVLHATAEGEASWYEFANEIIKQAQRWAIDETVKRRLAASVITIREDKEAHDQSTSASCAIPLDCVPRARRPPYAVLSNAAIEAYLGQTILGERRHWKEELIWALERFSQNRFDAEW